MNGVEQWIIIKEEKIHMPHLTLSSREPRSNSSARNPAMRRFRRAPESMGEEKNKKEEFKVKETECRK